MRVLLSPLFYKPSVKPGPNPPFLFCFVFQEALIVSSVLAKVSVPMLHSAVAILKLSQMDFSGANALFLRTLLLKKCALLLGKYGPPSSKPSLLAGAVMLAVGYTAANIYLYMRGCKYKCVCDVQYLLICIPPRDTSPHQDSAGTAPSGTPPPAQPPPPPQTRGTQSHSAPTPLKWPLLTPPRLVGAPPWRPYSRILRQASAAATQTGRD